MNRQRLSHREYPTMKAARALVETSPGFIYVAEVVGEPVIKIGFSLTPENRLRYLSKKRKPYRLLATTPATIAEERQLHRDLEVHGVPAGGMGEHYPRSILTHPAIPSGLRQPSPTTTQTSEAA